MIVQKNTAPVKIKPRKGPSKGTKWQGRADCMKALRLLKEAVNRVDKLAAREQLPQALEALHHVPTFAQRGAKDWNQYAEQLIDCLLKIARW